MARLRQTVALAAIGLAACLLAAPAAYAQRHHDPDGGHGGTAGHLRHPQHHHGHIHHAACAHLHVGWLCPFGTVGLGYHAFPVPAVTVFATPWGYGYTAYPALGWYGAVYRQYLPSYLVTPYGFYWYGAPVVVPVYGWYPDALGAYGYALSYRGFFDPPGTSVYQYRHRTQVYGSLVISILRHQPAVSHRAVPRMRPAWGHFRTGQR